MSVAKMLRRKVRLLFGFVVKDNMLPLWDIIILHIFAAIAWLSTAKKKIFNFKFIQGWMKSTRH